MSRTRTRFILGTFTFICLLSACLSLAQVSVWTQHNDNARTGQNLNETILNTSNVNVSNFGKLFWRTVDGYIYAQPLYVSGLNIAGATRNVVFVATEHNSVYAFDADDPNHPTPLWRVNLGTPVPSDDVPMAAPDCGSVTVCPYDDIQPEIGITATPVIDIAAKAMYVVTHTKNTSDSSYHFWLHKLDILSGADILSPVEITTSGFMPLYQLNRPGLLLLNGVVYVAFGSAGDFGDWHGWVMSYQASTLTPLNVHNDTPGNVQNFVQGESGGGGIFSCGQGLVTDGNFLYFFTGNGPFDVNTGGQDYGDSAIKLGSDLSFKDYFTPSDAVTLGLNNIDLGAGGPILLPGTNLLVGGGKDGILRVLNTSNMGQFNASDQVQQEWQAITNGNWIMGSPVYWNSPNWGPVIYLWVSGNVADAWSFNGSTFQQAPVSTGSVTSPAGESNTSPMSISANGQQEGILWAPTSNVGDPNKNIQPGILRAFDATNLGNELWNSEQNSTRDSLGFFAKFNPPTVANGKVYLGTFSGQLLVYGLNPPPFNGIAYVQGTSNALTSGSSSQISASYSSQTSGDLNVVVVAWGDTTSQIDKVTDSNGNVYSLAVPTQSSSQVTQAIYYAKNISGGGNTVTVTFKQAAYLPGLRILEYKGVDTTSPLDVTASAADTSSASAGAMANSGPAATHFSNELIFGAGTNSSNILKPGDAFVPRVVSVNSDLAEDHMVNVPDTYSATATIIPGSNWVMQMATFKAAVQPRTPPPPPPGGGFGLTASPSTATVTAGSSAAYTIAVSSQNGFSGTVALVCAGAPAGSQCSLSPGSVAAGSSASLTVTTSGPSAQLRTLPGHRAPFYALWLLLPGIAVAGAGWTSASRRRHALMLLLVAAVIAITFQLGCGGGGTSSPPPPPGGTPAGTDTLTVTGTSGNMQVTTPVTLVVQ